MSEREIAELAELALAVIGLVIMAAIGFYALGLLIWALPAILLWFGLGYLGLGPWPAGIIAGITYLLTIGWYLNWREEKSKASFIESCGQYGMSPSDYGREVELEGKVWKIIGLSGGQAKLKANKGDETRLFDPRLVASKLAR